MARWRHFGAMSYRPMGHALPHEELTSGSTLAQGPYLAWYTLTPDTNGSYTQREFSRSGIASTGYAFIFGVSGIGRRSGRAGRRHQRPLKALMPGQSGKATIWQQYTAGHTPLSSHHLYSHGRFRARGVAQWTRMTVSAALNLPATLCIRTRLFQRKDVELYIDGLSCATTKPFTRRSWLQLLPNNSSRGQ